MGRRGRATLADEEFFFVTTTVRGHARIFAEPKYAHILIKQIKSWQNHFQFDILGYVIMPSHFHWIVKVAPLSGTISDVMRELKSESAWAIMNAIEEDGRHDFSQTDTAHSRERRRFWERRFDDQVVRNQRMFMAKLSYIHNNPVKAGLVEKPEDYEFSSARNYINGDHSLLFVDTSYAG